MSATVHPETAHTSSMAGANSSAWARPPRWTRSADPPSSRRQRHSHHVGGRFDGQQGHWWRPPGCERRLQGGPPGAPGGSGGPHRDHPVVVMTRRQQGDGQGPFSEHGLGHVAPLDQGHAPVIDQLTQTQVDDLLETVEPVDVGMQQRAHPGTTSVPIAVPVGRPRVGRRRRTGGPG